MSKRETPATGKPVTGNGREKLVRSIMRDIFDEKKRFIAALAAQGTTIRLDTDILLQHKTLLAEAASQLAKALIVE